MVAVVPLLPPLLLPGGKGVAEGPDGPPDTGGVPLPEELPLEEPDDELELLVDEE